MDIYLEYARILELEFKLDALGCVRSHRVEFKPVKFAELVAYLLIVNCDVSVHLRFNSISVLFCGNATEILYIVM